MKRIPTPSGTKIASAERANADRDVLGGGAVGAAVTRRRRAHEHALISIDDSHEPSDLPARRAEPADARALTAPGLENASTVVVPTASDSRNLLAAQLVRARFDVGRVLVLANEPERVGLLADAGHDPVCATTALSSALADYV